jgi:pimeloyl-ACP methyl ester carboxylesterase
MRKLGVVGAIALAWLVGFVAEAAAQGKSLAGLGIVLLHGKGGQPGGNTASLAKALEAEGAIVITPRMAWAGSRGVPEKYDVTYEQALAPIGRAVDEAKAKGATRTVVGGQSLGANAAIAYAARHGTGLAGVIALAAGHTPERMKKPDMVASVAYARQLVASGKGNATATFTDINQGQAFNVQAKAAAYLSFFDPSGPANIPRNAAAMPPIPFLWVIGRSDPLAGAGRGYAFDRAPKNANSRYVEVGGGHFDTPTAAIGPVVTWLRGL